MVEICYTEVKGRAGYFYTCKQGEEICLGLPLVTYSFMKNKEPKTSPSHMLREMHGTTLENKEIIQGTMAPKGFVTTYTGGDDDD